MMQALSVQLALAAFWELMLAIAEPSMAEPSTSEALANAQPMLAKIRNELGWL